MFVDEVVRYWFAQYPWPGPTPEEVSAQLLERVGELVETRGELLPGALRALDLTSARGPLALASSTPMPLIIRCLKHFGLVDRFVAIRSADVEPYGKPHPGVFFRSRASA